MTARERFVVVTCAVLGGALGCSSVDEGPLFDRHPPMRYGPSATPSFDCSYTTHTGKLGTWSNGNVCDSTAQALEQCSAQTSALRFGSGCRDCRPTGEPPPGPSSMPWLCRCSVLCGPVEHEVRYPDSGRAVYQAWTGIGAASMCQADACEVCVKGGGYGCKAYFADCSPH